MACDHCCAELLPGTALPFEGACLCPRCYDAAALKVSPDAVDQRSGGGAMEPRRFGPGRLMRLCGCRRFFDWRAAHLVGFVDDGVERLELRNCPHCQSTRVVVVAVDVEALAAERRVSAWEEAGEALGAAAAPWLGCDGVEGGTT